MLQNKQKTQLRNIFLSITCVEMFIWKAADANQRNIQTKGTQIPQSYLHRWTQEIFQLETTPPENRIRWHKICDIIAIGAQLHVHIKICSSHVGTSQAIASFWIPSIKKWLRVKRRLAIPCSNTYVIFENTRHHLYEGSQRERWKKRRKRTAFFPWMKALQQLSRYQK